MSFKQHDKRGVIGSKVNGFNLARAHTVRYTRAVADAVQEFLARPTRVAMSWPRVLLGGHPPPKVAAFGSGRDPSQVFYKNDGPDHCPFTRLSGHHFYENGRRDYAENEDHE
jgi:hypothetical protein